ncbi:hypothetical protein Tco_1507781 [Tanacetum coccineum]
MNPESNPESAKRVFTEFTQPLPLIGSVFNRKIPIHKFFNNDLEYLMCGNKERKYALSLTKCPATVYHVDGIERYISKLFRSSIVQCDNDTELGINHWPELRKSFYKSRKAYQTLGEVHSDLKIKTVQSVKVERLFNYGYLSEIIVKQADDQEYTFKGPDFLILSLNDIEDMYVPKVKGKLHHLKGIESYQQSLNLTEPTYSVKDMKDIPLYTMIEKPYGVVYEDTTRARRFMGLDEVYKFGDGTITKISEKLDLMIKRHKIDEKYGHLGGRKWSVKDVRRFLRMEAKIERILRERKQMRRLESYVGGRPRVCDLRIFVRPE